MLWRGRECAALLRGTRTDCEVRAELLRCLRLSLLLVEDPRWRQKFQDPQLFSLVRFDNFTKSEQGPDLSRPSKQTFGSEGLGRGPDSSRGLSRSNLVPLRTHQHPMTESMSPISLHKEMRQQHEPRGAIMLCSVPYIQLDRCARGLGDAEKGIACQPQSSHVTCCKTAISILHNQQTRSLSPEALGLQTLSHRQTQWPSPDRQPSQIAKPKAEPPH